MTQLRQRMMDDMRVRNYSERTVRRYVECVAAFARFHGQCPSTLGPEEIRLFQVHLAVERRLSFTVLNQTVCALRFLYGTSLKANFPIDRIPYAKREQKLPVVLSRAEVEVLLAAATNPKHHAIVATFYSTAMRLSELNMLRTSDIDASRKIIRVNGKGAKQRQVPLTDPLLVLLRDYWRSQGVDSEWLFPGLGGTNPLDRGTIQKILRKCARIAGLDKRVTPHVLRHTCATHLLEARVDLLRIQRILGHSKIASTTVYLHLATDCLASSRIPLDLLPVEVENG